MISYRNYKQLIKPKSDPRGTLYSTLRLPDHLPLTYSNNYCLLSSVRSAVLWPNKCCGISYNNWVFIILKRPILHKVPSPKGLLRTSTRLGSVPVLLEPHWPLTTQQGVPPTGIHSLCYPLTRPTTNTIFANFLEIV